MADFPSLAALIKVGRDAALTANKKLTIEVTDTPGTDANAYIAAGGAIGQELVGQLAVAFAGVYLDSAEDLALDKYVFDRYGLLRKPAAPARGSVIFSTTAAAVATFIIPDGTVLSTPDGIQFITVGNATFLIGTTSSSPVEVRSVQAGSSQQAAIGTITSIVSQVPSSPSDLKVTNTVATAGADDAESDEDLRNRARAFFATAERGTLKAIEAAALAVPGVRKASAIEVLNASGQPDREVELIITDAFTEKLAELDLNPPAYQAQSQVLSTSVFNGLDDARAGGINVEVKVAQVVLQPVVLQLTFIAGVNVDSVAEKARATVVITVNNLKPGQALSVDTLRTELETVQGLIITGSEISSPAGDVVPTVLQVIRTTLGLVSALSTQSDRPLAATANPDAFVSEG